MTGNLGLVLRSVPLLHAQGLFDLMAHLMSVYLLLSLHRLEYHQCKGVYLDVDDDDGQGVPMRDGNLQFPDVGT
jgi:hypothetical protein